MPRFIYKCVAEGPMNNYFVSSCNFEAVFEEASYNCPICGTELLRVSEGLTVSEVLRLGQQRADKQKSQLKTKGTTKK